MVMREGVSAIDCVRKMHAVGLEMVRISGEILSQQQRLSSVEEAAETLGDDLDALRAEFSTIDRDVAIIKGERRIEERQEDRSSDTGLGTHSAVITGIFAIAAAIIGAGVLFAFEHWLH